MTVANIKRSMSRKPTCIRLEPPSSTYCTARSRRSHRMATSIGNHCRRKAMEDGRIPGGIPSISTCSGCRNVWIEGLRFGRRTMSCFARFDLNSPSMPDRDLAPISVDRRIHREVEHAESTSFTMQMERVCLMEMAAMSPSCMYRNRT